MFEEKNVISPLCIEFDQGRSQELEMGGAILLGEGSGGRLRPKGGCTCTLGTPLTTALPINTPRLYVLSQ